MSTELTFREANSDEISLLFDRIVKEGWNPGLYDPQTYPASDNCYFFVSHKNDKPISFVSCMIYQEAYAFVGCFVVIDPNQRGVGYGNETVNYLFDFIAKKGVTTIGCDGVIAQRDYYSRLGFVDAYLHRQFRYQVQGNEALEQEVSLSCPDLESLASFEARFVAEPRLPFWQAWASDDPTKKFASIHNKSGELSGFACLRKSQQGYRVGPVYAADIEDPIMLVHALCAQVPDGSQLYIDIPEGNSHSHHFIQQLGLIENNFDCMRMYRGVSPRVDTGGIFGVCTLEMG